MLSRLEQGIAAKPILVRGGEQINSWAQRRPDWLMKAEGNRNSDRQPASRTESARANACRARNQISTIHARRLE